VLRSETDSENVLSGIRKLMESGVMELRIEKVNRHVTKLYRDELPLHANVMNVADAGLLRLIRRSREPLTLIRRERNC
jgi:hypothetical protein